MQPIRTLALALWVSTLGQLVGAETLLKVDASAATPAPLTGHLKLGSARSPQGHTLAANSQYLLLDDWYSNGQRWQIGLRQFALKPAARLLPIRRVSITP